MWFGMESGGDVFSNIVIWELCFGELVFRDEYVCLVMGLFGRYISFV